jgi:hypothetical protein
VRSRTLVGKREGSDGKNNENGEDNGGNVADESKIYHWRYMKPTKRCTGQHITGRGGSEKRIDRGEKGKEQGSGDNEIGVRGRRRDRGQLSDGKGGSDRERAHGGCGGVEGGKSGTYITRDINRRCQRTTEDIRVRSLKISLEGRIDDDKWDVEAAEFGRNMKAMGKMIEAFGFEADIADFPRLRAQLAYGPGQEIGALGTQAETTEDENEGEQTIEEEQRST